LIIDLPGQLVMISLILEKEVKQWQKCFTLIDVLLFRIIES